MLSYRTVGGILAVTLLQFPGVALSDAQADVPAYNVSAERNQTGFQLNVSVSWCPGPDLVPAFRLPPEAKEPVIRDSAGTVLPSSQETDSAGTTIWTGPMRGRCLALSYSLDRPIESASEPVSGRFAMTGDIPVSTAGVYLPVDSLLPTPNVPNSAPYTLALEAGSNLELVTTTSAAGSHTSLRTSAFAVIDTGHGGRIVPVSGLAQIAFLNMSADRQQVVITQLERLNAYIKATMGLEHAGFTLIASDLPEHFTGPWISGRGHGTTGAMVAFSNPGDQLGLLWLVAHEVMHQAIPFALAPEATVIDVDRQKWFIEGTNDYLAIKSLVRTGSITPAQAAIIWSRLAREHASSSVRGEPADQIAARFWTDPASQRWPYLNGAMIAAAIDQRMMAASSGALQIEDAIGVMARSSDRSGHALGRRLQEAVLAVSGVDVSDLVAQAAEGPPMAVPARLPDLCLASTEQTVPVFELGFDFFSLLDSDGTLQSVTGPAREAGLRPGLRLVRNTTVNRWDGTASVAWLVDTGAGETTVSWLPAGDRTIKARVFEPIPGCEPARLGSD